MNTLRTLSASIALAAVAALPASAGAASAPDAPRFAATPAVSFTVVSDSKGHFVSLGAVVRLRHTLTDRQRRTFGLLAGPLLRPGQTVPDELFGGTTLGRIGSKGRHCYFAEVSQLRRHAAVDPGAVWRVAFTDGRRVAAQVRSVTLRRGHLERSTARQLGCYA